MAFDIVNFLRSNVALKIVLYSRYSITGGKGENAEGRQKRYLVSTGPQCTMGHYIFHDASKKAFFLVHSFDNLRLCTHGCCFPNELQISLLNEKG